MREVRVTVREVWVTVREVRVTVRKVGVTVREVRVTFIPLIKKPFKGHGPVLTCFISLHVMRVYCKAGHCMTL